MNLSNSGNFGFDRERGTEETLSLPIQMLQLKTRAKLQSPFSVGDLPFNAPYSPRNVTSGARWWLVAWGLCDGRKKKKRLKYLSFLKGRKIFVIVIDSHMVTAEGLTPAVVILLLL